MIERPETSRESPAQPPSFRTTHWSAVLAAREPDAPAANEALERLCAAYWRPLYGFVRRSGRLPEEAEDLTQEFFARMLARRYLGLADPARGRFRTFLLCALKRFLADEWDRQRAQKRGGGARPRSLEAIADDTLGMPEPADTRTPEAVYDRQWAETLLAEVLRRLELELTAAGKSAEYTVLKVFLTGDKGELSLAEAAARLGLSELAVKSWVHRLRRRYAELVRETVADTLQDPRDLEDELRHLLAALQA